MQWLSENWVTVVLLAGVAAMFLFGHGAHGGHGGHGGSGGHGGGCGGHGNDRKSSEPETAAGTKKDFHRHA